MTISISPVGLWFMGTNTSGKCKKKSELALIGTLLSVAQNPGHKYNNDKNKTHKREKVEKNICWKWFKLLFQFFFFYEI